MDKTTYENCAEFLNDTRKIVVCKDENSRTEYRYENKALDELSKYRVDGCLIKDESEGERCDFLLENCTKKILYFVELKGSDLIRAVKQINHSIDVLYGDFENEKYAVHARIVVTRVSVPNLENNSYFVKLQKKVKKLNGEVRYRAEKYIEHNSE
jgi:hypothetical protein